MLDSNADIVMNVYEFDIVLLFYVLVDIFERYIFSDDSKKLQKTVFIIFPVAPFDTKEKLKYITC